MPGKKSTARNVLTAFFGNVDNQKVADELRRLSSIVRECSEELQKGIAMDLDDIVEDEHHADEALERLSMALEKAFILRASLEKSEVTHLGHELDNAIDGMRDAAEHIATFRRFLPVMPESGTQIIQAIRESVAGLDEMIKELTANQKDRERMNKLAARISELERKADRIKNDAIQELVDRDTFSDYREFDAIRDLVLLLEGITDNVKHCAVIALSLSRREA